jgi:iron complex transport system permease protein
VTTAQHADAPGRRGGPAGRVPPRPTARRATARPLILLVLALLVAFGAVASLTWGARDVDLTTVWQALTGTGAGNDVLVVRDLRVPRTVLGLVAGAALGLAGALMQGLTRNPIADPGLLGVNGGASLAVVVGITWFGVGDPAGYVWFALAGAAGAAVLVHLIAAAGPEGPTPVRLALVGAALAAVATSLVTLVLLTRLDTLDQYRFWAVGSLVGRPLETVTSLAPFLVLGGGLALMSARLLDALALGEDVARGLGQNVARGRVVVLAAIVLLCGGATALVGPIAFVGLVVPHVARRLTGTDHRWVLPCSALLGALLLLVADVIGRLVVQPGELEAGLVVALAGAPVMIALIRRTRSVAL